MPSFSLIGALEFRSVVSSLQNQASGSQLSVFDTPVTPYAGGHYHSPVHHHPPRSRSHTPQPTDENPWDATLGLPLDDRPPRSPSPSDQHDYNTEDTTIHSAMPLDYQSDNEAQITKPSRIHILRGAAHVLFPSLHGFREKSVLGQVASLFAAPALLMLTLTLPVVVTPYNGDMNGHEKGFDTSTRNLVDFEEEGIERTLVAEEEREEELHGVGFNKWLMAAQCVFGPLFCIGVLFGELGALVRYALTDPICSWALTPRLAAVGERHRWTDHRHHGDCLRGQGGQPNVPHGALLDGLPRRRSLDHGHRRRGRRRTTGELRIRLISSPSYTLSRPLALSSASPTPSSASLSSRWATPSPTLSPTCPSPSSRPSWASARASGVPCSTSSSASASPART